MLYRLSTGQGVQAARTWELGNASINRLLWCEGELTLVLDDSEVTLRPGSVVVQCGSNHAWANRSGAPARVAFVLIAGSA